MSIQRIDKPLLLGSQPAFGVSPFSTASGTTPIAPVSGLPQFSGPARDTLQLRFAGRIQDNLTERQARQYLEKYGTRMQELEQVWSESDWNLSNQGADYVGESGKRNEEVSNETWQAYQDYCNNPQALAEGKALMAKIDRITQWPLRRQLETMVDEFYYATMSPKLQSDIITLTNKLSGAWDSYRGEYRGRKLSDSEIGDKLVVTRKTNTAAELWQAYSGQGDMKLDNGKTLAEGLIDLVRMRNRLATENGFSDYFSMQMQQQAIDEPQLVQLMAEVEKSTREPYERLQKAQDKIVSKRFKVSEAEARLPYYRMGNDEKLFDFDLSDYVNGQDPVDIIKRTARLMGDDLNQVIKDSVYERDGKMRSSLYMDPKKDHGKSQHWYCFGIHAPWDVRIFGSVDPKHQSQMAYSVQTLLHEGVGHGIDYKRLSPRLPANLRDHHSITTESNAMLMESLLYNRDWLIKVLKVPAAKADAMMKTGKPYAQAELINGLRDTMAIIDFERQMYKNPEQDLSKLWWDLQEKYMLLKRPPGPDKPTYAYVPHYFSGPAYYPAYLIADLRRAQVLAHINQKYGSLLTREAGDYLATYRAKGDTYSWDDVVERMTGKALSIDDLKAEYADFEIPKPASRRKSA